MPFLLFQVTSNGQQHGRASNQSNGARSFGEAKERHEREFQQHMQNVTPSFGKPFRAQLICLVGLVQGLL